MKRYILLFSALSMILLMAFITGEKSTPVVPIYLDTTYSFEERAADLVSRLTIEEKQNLIGNSMAAVPRLGINTYNVWGEALHGVVRMFNPNYESATSFPNSIALGATWDPELMKREATTISDEARGVNHAVIAGLTYWSPVVEPARDPRWGRTGESFGEDPFLISRIAGGFIRGIMGDDPKYLKAVPTGKHYLANNSEFNRHTGTSNMDDRDMREFYLAPYKKLIEKDELPSIMTCYNRVNGVPVTASTFFVDSIARKTYGLNGYVTGDCGAVSDIYTGHNYVNSNAEAAALALKAGVDTDCGNVFQSSAIDALHAGLIEEADIDKALVHMFTIRMRIGEFDPKDQVPYSHITPETANAPEHQALAIEVATKTPVLLKNNSVSRTNKKALPLQANKMNKIAVIGPMANRVVLGPYSGTPLEANTITPLAGIKSLLSEKGYSAEVAYSAGANTMSRSNLFTISKFYILNTNGKTTEFDATNYDESSGNISISTSNNISSLRRINDDNWTSYHHIDISNMDSIHIDVSVQDAGGSIEVRSGSITGNVLATFEIPGNQEYSGSFIFGRNRTVKAKVNQLGIKGQQNLYFIYHAPAVIPIDQETLDIASSSDAAIVFVGTDDRTASEESDRLTLLLPGNQYELIKAVAEVNPHTVVVMQTLGMVEVDQFKDIPGVAGIIWTGYNGQAQGVAMAKILFGEANPGGKLNTTWYKSLNDLPDITNYNLRGSEKTNGRTYWYFDKDVSYEFGYGLSYTTFEYSNFRISKSTFTPNDKITIQVDVKNSGEVDGDEVVQLYMRTPDSEASLERPIKRLKGFQKANIPAGQTTTVTIEIDCADLWFWDEQESKMTFDQGKVVFEIGASSKDIRGQVEAVMNGTYNALLKTVVAECPTVIMKQGETTQTLVSAVLSDDQFYDISKAQVRYESNNPEVVRVDLKGKVTATGAGVASITAHVTIDGTTKSDSYALKVLPDLRLSNITLNGKEIQQFNPQTHSYGILLDKKTKSTATANAKPADNSVSVDIKQAETLPGTTIITLTDPVTGEKDSYTVNFGYPSGDEEFNNATPGEQWNWVRENSKNWTCSEHPGFLCITSQNGDVQGNSNNAENLLLQSANTDWVLESKLEFSRRPVKVGEQAGILAYQDDDHYVKLIYTYNSGGMMAGNDEYIELAVERFGSQYSSAKVPTSELFRKKGSASFFLKLEKKGDLYTAFFSVDGTSFTKIGSTKVVLCNIKAGLITCDGTSPDFGMFSFRMPTQQEDLEPLKVKYDYLRIINTGINQ